jgi:hypothetical protein
MGRKMSEGEIAAEFIAKNIENIVGLGVKQSF